MLQGDATVPAGTTVMLTKNTTSEQVTCNNAVRDPQACVVGAAL